MIASSIRTIGLCAFAILMILSDCTSLLGQWAYSLKYAGIVIICALCVFSAVLQGIEKRKLTICLIGLALLVAIIPFQTGTFSVVQSIALYVAVFVLACLSSKMLASTRQLLIVCIVALLLIIVLLALSYESVVDQWNFYLRQGRPRFKGCFSNPNSLGNIAAILFVGVSCARRAGTLPRGFKVASVACLLVSFLLVLGSGSRTALVVVFGFLASYWLIKWFLATNDVRLRMLYVFLYICAMIGLLLIVFNMLSSDASLRFRVRTLLAIDITSPEAMVGLGYVSSEGISQITSAAGGATDMLYVSLFYRVGIIGCIAYTLFIIGAATVDKKSTLNARCLAVAILIALLLQAAGESYLSSVMSFVSCFDWLALGAFPALINKEEQA